MKGCLRAWRASINSLRRISPPGRRSPSPRWPPPARPGPHRVQELLGIGLTQGLDLTFDLGVNKCPTPTCGTQAVGTPGPEAPQV